MIDYRYNFIEKTYQKLDNKLYKSIQNKSFILEGLEGRWIIHDIRDAIKQKVIKKFKNK
jgi:hypothetical protein